MGPGDTREHVDRYLSAPFLPYDAVPIMKNEILEKYPELKEVLNRLSSKISHEQMQQLNDEVDVEKQKPKR